MLEKTPELKKHVDNILDVFGGADGGMAFHAFALVAEEMGTRTGDEGAAKVVRIITDFSNLLTACDNYARRGGNAKA